MLVHELGQNPGKITKGKRVGRGNSSGRGNYSRRGMKGQDSRSGGGVPHTFEGGQTPLNRRLPKLRGFKRFFKLSSITQPIKLARIEADDRIANGATISKQDLLSWGYIRSATENVKILGKSKITKKLQFEDIEAASAGALAAIEAVGGSVSFAGGTVMQQQQ